jgi:hypothetical protein
MLQRRISERKLALEAAYFPVEDGKDGEESDGQDPV